METSSHAGGGLGPQGGGRDLAGAKARGDGRGGGGGGGGTAEEETDEANEAVEAGIKAEIGAASALERGPPPAVFGKRKRSEVGGEEAQRCESKGTTSEGAAAEGAAAAGETRPIKQPKLRNTALVNRRVRVWWGGDRQWFAGVVTSYSSRRGHQVQYDDGEIKTHWLDNSAGVQWKLDC